MIIILALNHYNNKNNNYHRDHNSQPPHRQTVPRQQQDEELCDHRSRKVTCPGPDKTRFFTVFVNIVLYCHSYMTDVVVLILAPQIQIVPVESSHCRFVGFVFVYRLCLCHCVLSSSMSFYFVIFCCCHCCSYFRPADSAGGGQSRRQPPRQREGSPRSALAP